jgi:c-di-GMP-binding flagellar brake protein YcgR
VSDKQDIHEALKAAGAPDYMVLIISKIMGAEDAVREMMAALSARSVELHQREQVLEHGEQMLADRQQAFVDAANDMKAFATKIYGPDSELTKINAKLGAIESAGMNRDQRYALRFQAIDENQTRLKDWATDEFQKMGTRFEKLEDRVTVLESKKAG